MGGPFLGYATPPNQDLIVCCVDFIFLVCGSRMYYGAICLPFSHMIEVDECGCRASCVECFSCLWPLVLLECGMSLLHASSDSKADRFVSCSFAASVVQRARVCDAHHIPGNTRSSSPSHCTNGRGPGWVLDGSRLCLYFVN